MTQSDMKTYSRENGDKQRTDINSQGDRKALTKVEFSCYQQFHVSWALKGQAKDRE